MHTCIICRFDIDLDDVELHGPSNRCICLNCYERESDSERPMPKTLRREISELLALMSEAV